MAIEIPDKLIAWAKSHIGREDDLGMTQKLGEAFDNLSLGVNPNSLGDIIAIAAVFIQIQGAAVESTIAERFAQMEADLEKFKTCPLLGPVRIPVILPLAEVASASS